jgi:hypothetical protein
MAQRPESAAAENSDQDPVSVLCVVAGWTAVVYTREVFGLYTCLLDLYIRRSEEDWMEN